MEFEFEYNGLSILADCRAMAEDDWSIEYISVMNEHGREIDFDYLTGQEQNYIMDRINDLASESCHEAYHSRWHDYDDIER